MRIVTNVFDQEAQELLTAPEFSFDIESDTADAHWQSGSRGLSYCTDITEIGFYCGQDWTLVLSAVPYDIEYEAQLFERNAEGVLEEVYQPFKGVRYKFNEGQIEFIKAMFSRDTPVTAIAHNLIFDARMIFGKFKLPVKPNYTLWDTRSVYLLRDGWRPASIDDTPSDDDDDDDTPNKEGKADLLSVYEMYVQKLDSGYRAFIEFMKKQRKHFPVIKFDEMTEEALQYLMTEPSTAPHTDALNAYLVALAEKKATKSTKLKKVIQAGADEIDLQPLVDAMMEHYVSFDIVACFEIAQAQMQPITDYPKYQELLPIDLLYQHWCVESSSRGQAVNRDLAVAKLKAATAATLVEIEKMGLTAADWDRVSKRDYIIQFMFWESHGLDARFKDGTNYAKNVKEAITALELAGVAPDNEIPTFEVLQAYQFKLLTKKGQVKLSWLHRLRRDGDLVYDYLKKYFGSKDYRQISKTLKIAKAEVEQWLDMGHMSANDLAFGAKAMEVWQELFPEMPELQQIGRISKLSGAIIFLESILRESEFDGRVHSLIGRFTTTGRNSSSVPNLQNQHFGDDPVLGNLINMAGILIPRKGHVFTEHDLFNAENVSAAMISADSNMAYACCATDFHMARALFFWGKECADLYKEDPKAAIKKFRKIAKQLGLAEGYGMGATKLAVTLGVTVDEAKELLAKSAAAFPDLTMAKEKARKFASENGWIPTWTGRRIKIPMRSRYDERDGSWKKEYSSYTSGWNSPNQGAVAEIIVRATNALRQMYIDENLDTQIALQVHDSLIMDFEPKEYPYVPQKIAVIMGSILDGIVRYKAKGDEPAVTWNESTSPAIRWLVDLDNMGNADKWGLQDGVEYPLPLTEYVNRWGVFQMTEEEIKTGKAPTWINSFGYGEDALKRELAGELGVELELPALAGQREGFQWNRLQHAFNQVQPYIAPMNLNGHVLDFPTAIAVLQTQYERGENKDFANLTHELDKLAKVMKDYAQWIG